MVITKKSDGTTSYSGITVPTVDCFAQALDLKYKKSQLKLLNCLKKVFIHYRVEYVTLKLSNVVKYGPEMAQLVQIQRRVL